MSKNIGFDAKRAFNNQRGLGNYSRETIRILSTYYPDNQYFLFTPKVNSNIHFPLPENSQVRMPHGLQKCSPSLWRTFSLAGEAQKCHLDLFHGLSHELPVGIQKKNIPTVVTIHDLIFLKFPQLYPTFDRTMYKRKYLRSCELADRIIAVSEQTRRDLVELAGIDDTKIDVVYQGCSPIFRQPLPPEIVEEVRRKYGLPSQFVLSIGALEKRKNHILILQALANQQLDIPVVIVGNETAYAPALRRFIVEHHLEKQVTLLSGVPFSEFPALYRCASLFVYPSLFEGFGIPVLEAVTMGVPTIAATGSCLEESGGPGSRYVSPHDPEALADQMKEVLENSDLRAQMVADGLAHSSRFTDEAIACNLWNSYERALGN